MDYVGQSPAQYQGRECARHVLQRGIVAADHMDPPDNSLQTTGARLPHPSRFRLAEVGVDKGAHGQLCRDPSALGAADAIGNRGDDPKTRLLLGSPQIDAAIILILRATSSLSAQPNPYLEMIDPRGRTQTKDSVTNPHPPSPRAGSPLSRRAGSPLSRIAPGL